MKTYLYILTNITSRKYYIGITGNIIRRLKEHNVSNKHYTGRIKGGWVIVYKKIFQDLFKAKTEENRLKKAKNRKYIDWYINNK